MADQENKTPAPAVDKSTLLAQLDKVQKETEALAGTKGVNPFVYVRDKVTPLRTALEGGAITPELVKAIQALKPLVAPKAPEPAAKK